jgi:hypothetical protein
MERDRTLKPLAASPMIVVIAGSRKIPPGEVGRMVVDFLGKLPPDTTILLRKGMVTEAGQFEQMVEMVCDLMGLKVEWRQPGGHVRGYQWIGDESGDVIPKQGRQLVFDRDLQMAADCDFAVCFTTIEQAYDMECGTTALAQKVLEADKAVYHYGLPDDDLPEGYNIAPLILMGSHDPGNKFARYMPS